MEAAEEKTLLRWDLEDAGRKASGTLVVVAGACTRAVHV